MNATLQRTRTIERRGACGDAWWRGLSGTATVWWG